jgi:hypothetical protein
MRSGGVTRRASTEVIGDFGTDLDPTNSFYAPFRRNDGSLAIIWAKDTGSSVVFKWIDTSDGTVSSAIGTISGTSNITLSKPVQAGPSQFWTLGSEPVCRIVESTAGAFTLEQGDPTTVDDLYWFQMQGLWSYDKTVAENTIYAEPQTGTAAYDEFNEQASVILAGSTTLAAAATARTILEDEEPEEGSTDTNQEVLTINQLSGFTDTVAELTSFADSRLAGILGGGAGDADYFPHAKNVEFFQGRLVLSDFSDGPRSWVRPVKSAIQPEDRITINLSQSGSPFTIKPGSADPDAPIELSLFTRSGQTINWMLATDLRLFIGLDNEIISFAGDPLTPETINSKQTLNIGTEPSVYPIQDNTRLVFLSSGKGGVYAAEFQDAVQGYQGLELSKYAYHLVNDITELHLTPIVQGDPAKRMWCLKADGTVACMAVLDDLDPRIPPAWSTISLAEDVQIKALVSDADDLFGIVEDPTNANSHAVIKFTFEDSPDFVLDMKETVTGSDTTSWAVANSYLEGKDVYAAVYDDGVLVHTGTYTVSSGNITTSVAGDSCQLGLVFNSKVKLFDTQITDSLGPTQLRKHKIVKLNAYVKNTRGLDVNGKKFIADTPPTPSTVVNPVTGTVSKTKLGWDTEHEIEFTGVAGYNFTMLGISREVEI